MTVQNKQSGPEVAQTVRRAGKTQVDYWAPRLQRRTFSSGGIPREVPGWFARIKHQGRREWFNLGTENKDAAARVARDIYVSLFKQGWEPTLAKFKPKTAPVEGDMTVEKFGEYYRETAPKLEHPPSRPTSERYLKSLAIICGFEGVGVKRISELTADRIEDFKAAYLKAGRKEKRDEDSIKITVNSILRNAAGLFSRPMLALYQREGLPMVNPFAGSKLRRISIPTYEPLPTGKLDSIWKDSIDLRDGNPEAKPVFKARQNGHAGAPDWTQPHPEAYLLLLLELGLGLRRNEADKAEWSWLRTEKATDKATGKATVQHFMGVQSTRFFVPKSKAARTIPVEPALHTAIMAYKEAAGASPFIVPGNNPTPLAESTAKNITYRCDRHHRTLTAWLRDRGIDDGKPCHLLRKEFGSYVATAFGLFVAQKLLGHSSPVVTSDFYAGLTDLPELNHAKVQAQAKGVA